MNNPDYDAFAAQYPANARLSKNLARMEAAISSRPFVLVFEPVALKEL
jgi:hypothetical protein